jgi:hypothetical protein
MELPAGVAGIRVLYLYRRDPLIPSQLTPFSGRCPGIFQDRSRKVQNVLDLVEQFLSFCLPVVGFAVCEGSLAVTCVHKLTAIRT